MPESHVGEALEALSILAFQGGGVFLDDDDVLVQKRQAELDAEERERVEAIYDSAWNGFFKCAEAGHSFGSISAIAIRFGCSLEENYPGATPAFLRFATTYWTLRILEGGLSQRSDIVLWLLLRRLMVDVGCVFFPMPGPSTIPVAERESAQREILTATTIDIEEFMVGNIALRRERERERRETRHRRLGASLFCAVPIGVGVLVVLVFDSWIARFLGGGLMVFGLLGLKVALRSSDALIERMTGERGPVSEQLAAEFKRLTKI